MNASAGAGAGGGADSVQGLLDAQWQGHGLGWGLAALGLLAGWWIFRPVWRRVRPALLARYDGRFQSPPLPADSAAVRHLLNSPAGQELLAWCWAGARSTPAPWWRPAQRSVIGQPVSLAVMGEPAPVSAALAQAFALEMDGSLQLQRRQQAAAGRWAGLALRLRVKWADLCWWRPHQLTDPWDAGYLLNHADTPAHLASWLPRRASLLLADDLPPALLQSCLQKLHARRAFFEHPVRLLILRPPADVQALLGQSGGLHGHLPAHLLNGPDAVTWIGPRDNASA